MKCLFWCHTEYVIRSSFAIPEHKTCEDSRDKRIQFVLEAAPQHQHPMMHISSFSRRVLISVLNELKNGKSLIQNLMFLKLIEIRERKTHLCVLVGVKDLQYTKITIYLFVDVS